MIKRTIKGVEYQFDYECLAALYEMIDANANDVSFLYTLVSGGIKGYAVRNRVKIDISIDDIIEYVDEQVMSGDTFADLQQALADSKKWQSLIKKGQEVADDKKKAQENSLPT